MLTTQKLIVILGNYTNIAQARNVIAGFKAVTVIRSLTPYTLRNVYYFNKNAVYFTETYDFKLMSNYSPIVIQLSSYSTSVEKMVLSVDNILEDFPKLLSTCGVDTGDHISASTDRDYVQPQSDCLICKILNRQSDYPEHILYETDNFFVVPGTGAFYEGYIMIVPKRHVMSFANLNESELDEFFMVYSNLSAILSSIYNKPIFGFECGSGKTGAGKHKTSIVHAHFHMACTNMPVLKEVQASGLTPQLISKENLLDFYENPYMLYVDQDNNYYISCDTRDYYPRQHPRQVLAHWMQEHERSTLSKTCKSLIAHMSSNECDTFFDTELFYNWRNFPMRERMDEIAKDFRSFCKNYYESLSQFDKMSIRFSD